MSGNLLRVLYFENHEGTSHNQKANFKVAWDKLQTGVGIEIITAGTVSECLDLLRNGKFNLLIADLLGPPEEGDGEDEPVGLDLIRLTRQASELGGEGIGILAYSRAAELEEKAKKFGADVFLNKAEIRGSDPEFKKLQGAFREALGRSSFDESLVGNPTVFVEEGDLSATATCESIGRENFEDILGKLFDGRARSVTVSAVRSGLSGADVVRTVVEFKPQANGVAGGRKNFLVKLSRSHGQMVRERDGLKLARDIYPDRLLPTLYRDNIADAGDYSAIALTYIAEAETLLDWLSETDRYQQSDLEVDLEVEGLLRKLFSGDGLLAGWGRGGFRKDLRPSRSIWQILTLRRRAAIGMAIGELSDLLYEFGGILWSPRLVENFLSDAMRIGELNEEDIAVGRGARLVLSHGDLHSRNLLVDQDGRGWIIDGGDIGASLPWPADLARISIDLLLSGLDRGSRSYKWSRIPEWISVVEQFLEGGLGEWKEESSKDTPDRASDSPDNRAVVCALHWLRKQPLMELGVGSADMPEWQLVLAYSVEFLRSLYRLPDLTPPKRVLAGLGACLSLQKVEEMIGSR